ncbi:hypothetical protein INS49_012287 [Diaporthe citri]|uniref:uncharacterized protein n=1 Tax=Diaporthe citri TaxID=83186 RepID=UPI001C7F1B84|nr:uncharacterized protein INS49_012287 [Diaporthe citri]KAG6358768.1 hypothetical protein INS49_012287 [Diaporthe citri]
MSFTSRANMTVTELHITQWPLTVGLSTLAAVFLGFLAFLSYTPTIHEKSPKFTSHTSPFIGSFGFGTDPWNFWKGSRDESKTGNFSFWLGSRHIVGVTGEAARKMFFDHPQMEFVQGQFIRAMGVHFWPPVHDIFKPGFHGGRANTYFLRRLLELQKTEHLSKYLPRMLTDARLGLRALQEDPHGITNTSDSFWRTIFTQDCRVLCADEMADSPRLFEGSSDSARTLLHTFTHYNVHFPWLLSPAYLKRRYARYRLWSNVKAIVEKRMNRNPGSADEPVQTLINNGDVKDHVIEFFTSLLFIAPANSSIIVGKILSFLAMRTDLQDRIYEEVRSVAEAHSGKGGGSGSSLVEQLGSIPLEAWESSFPTIGLCLKEAIRMWTAFSMARFNDSDKPIPIPGSDEVVPGNTFVCYNTTEVNFSEKLYPNANYFDPDRFTEGREEFKRETYGFVGWGQGRHNCAGMRWAKLQQNIIIAYSLAMYQWKNCDENGQVITDIVYKRPRA